MSYNSDLLKRVKNISNIFYHLDNKEYEKVFHQDKFKELLDYMKNGDETDIYLWRVLPFQIMDFIDELTKEMKDLRELLNNKDEKINAIIGNFFLNFIAIPYYPLFNPIRNKALDFYYKCKDVIDDEQYIIELQDLKLDEKNIRELEILEEAGITKLDLDTDFSNNLYKDIEKMLVNFRHLFI